MPAEDAAVHQVVDGPAGDAKVVRGFLQAEPFVHGRARAYRRTGASKHVHRCLHTAMERAVRWRLIAVNPVDGVEPPHVPERETAVLQPVEAGRLVQALAGAEYEVPFLVGLFCGLRPTEYLALRWRDVDLDRGELRVVQNVHRVRNDRITVHMARR